VPKEDFDIENLGTAEDGEGGEGKNAYRWYP